MNQDLNYQDLILVIDEAYPLLDRLGRKVVDTKTGQVVLGSTLEDAKQAHQAGRPENIIDYMWRGEQSKINFFLLTKVKMENSRGHDPKLWAFYLFLRMLHYCMFVLKLNF